MKATTLLHLNPGQHFVVVGASTCRGVLERVSDCAATVTLPQALGGRTTIAPGTVVWPVAGPDTPPPAVVRPNILGHRPAAVVAYCGAAMWTPAQVQAMLWAYDIKMPAATVALHMERGRTGVGMPAADLTDAQELELEACL